MTTSISRRDAIRASVAGAFGIAVSGSVQAIAAPGAEAMTRRAAGYGALVTDPAGRLSLPPGFSYKVVAQAGDTCAKVALGVKALGLLFSGRGLHTEELELELAEALACLG